MCVCVCVFNYLLIAVYLCTQMDHACRFYIGLLFHLLSMLCAMGGNLTMLYKLEGLFCIKCEFSFILKPLLYTCSFNYRALLFIHK